MVDARDTADSGDFTTLDTVVALVGLVASVVALPLYLLFDNLFVLGLPLAVIVGAVVYLVSALKPRPGRMHSLAPWAGQVLAGFVLFGLAALIVIAVQAGQRTDAFHHLAIAVGVLLFYQILFGDERTFNVGLVLGQVVLFVFVLRFAALYTTPGYVGIDIWTHMADWTEAIVATNSLEPMAENKYFASPVYHLLVATTAMFADLPVRSALHLSVGVVVPLVTVLVYSLARMFVDVRWSTLAAALFGIVGYSIEWSIHLIPTSLGLAFFVAIVYLLARMQYLGSTTRLFLLTWFLGVAVVLTHQIATFILLVVLMGGILAQLLLSFDRARDTARSGFTRSDTLNLSGLFVFYLGFVTFMWSWTPHQGGNFLMTSFNFFRHTLVESEGFGDLASQREAAPDTPPIEATQLETFIEVIDAAGILLLVCLGVIGGLYALQRQRRTHATLTAVVSVGIMSVFVFGFPMFGVRAFVPSRWYAFLAVPLILLGVVGLSNLHRRLDPTVLVVILVVLALVFPTVALLSSNATEDSPRFEGEQTRYGYTSAELAAIDAVGESFQPAALGEDVAPLATDHPYHVTFERSGLSETDIAPLEAEAREDYALLIHRDYQRSGGAIFVDEFGRTYGTPVTHEELCLPARHTVYDNGEVRMCVTS